MQKLNFLIYLIVLTCISFPPSANTINIDYNENSYRNWIADLKKEAEILGYKSIYINSIIDNAEYLPKIVELDRKQPEFNKTFWMYLNNSVTSDRIRSGKLLIKKHLVLLNEIQKKYGVPPRFIIAFLGLESNYGKNTGNFKVINALVTLSYDNRRGQFFRNELFNLLDILNSGTIKNSNVLGSWAGAMGQIQFMPSTYKNYAIDENNDGIKDIWNSLPDIFASAANYLNKIGWQKKYTWGREVLIPEVFDFLLADLNIKKPLSEWDKLGIKKINGQPLPKSNVIASVILPGGINGPAFLVYKNFEVIKTWNNSILYAISIGHLADRIIGLKKIQKPRLTEEPLSRSQIITIQKNLNSLGFSAGIADGRVGPKTRNAIRAFQQVNDLPPDGYADIKVLKQSITKIQETAQN